MTVSTFFLLLIVIVNAITTLVLLCTRPSEDAARSMMQEIHDRDRFITFRTGKYEDKCVGDEDYPKYYFQDYYVDSDISDRNNIYKREIVKKIPINPDLISKIIDVCGIELDYEPKKVETTPEKCELVVKKEVRKRVKT